MTRAAIILRTNRTRAVSRDLGARSLLFTVRALQEDDSKSLLAVYSIAQLRACDKTLTTVAAQQSASEQALVIHITEDRPALEFVGEFIKSGTKVGSTS